MIFSSPSPDVIIPEIFLQELVLDGMQELGDKPALIDGTTGHSISYRRLGQETLDLAAGLKKRGFTKGDVFAIYSPNLPEYAVAFHGIARAGGTVTTVNPLYSAEELAHQLNDAGASYLLTVGAFLDKAREAAAQSSVKEIFTFDQVKGVTPFSEIIEPGAEPPDVTIDPREDLAVIPYSSGTTGLSKGVMLTHYNLVANICQIEGTQDTDLVDGKG